MSGRLDVRVFVETWLVSNVDGGIVNVGQAWQRNVKVSNSPVIPQRVLTVRTSSPRQKGSGGQDD